MLYTLFAISIAVVLALVLVNRVPLSYTLRNLTVRWITTSLTVLAFVLVIFIMVVMLAFTTGMKRMTEGTGEPTNVLVLSEGADDEVVSTVSAEVAADLEGIKMVLPADDGKDSKKKLASRETYLIVNQPVAFQRPGRPHGRFLQIRGVVDVDLARRVHDVQLHEGGAWFSQAGTQANPNPKEQNLIQVVLGEGMAQALGKDRSPEAISAARNKERLDVGDTFGLGWRQCIVTGVMKSSGSTYNSEIWGKQDVIAPLFGKTAFTTVVLRAADADAAVKLRDDIKENFKKQSVVARLEKDYYSGLSETSNQFLYAIIFVTAVMGVGGVFGVMNTMFAAISHRIKDIGVLRILGYTRRQVLVSFLLESLVIALLGGLAGCALGSLTNGVTANSMVGAGNGGGKSVVVGLVVDANIWAAGMFLAVLMGAIGGLAPAVSAIRLKPLDALR
jgi:ABC-type lipoprotein release transport system permease subunit